LTRPDVVVQIGLPARRIDILTSISAALVRNKRASGRAKDQADLEALGEA
jgi:hypothetical protein